MRARRAITRARMRWDDPTSNKRQYSQWCLRHPEQRQMLRRARDRKSSETRLTDSIALHGIDKKEPEMGLPLGIAFRVAFAPRGNILGYAELHPERALELGCGNGASGKSVVGGGGGGGAAIQVAGDTVAGVEAAVAQMELALVPRFGVPQFGAAADSAEGTGAVTVDEVDINLLLGSSAKAARSSSGGGAAAQSGGPRHGVTRTGEQYEDAAKRGAGMCQNQRDQEYGQGKPESLIWESKNE
ncbi:hypothetical protein C8F04DRAFT_1173227 [Mycena alexandri]|uniref:Uncharacterized protein n=1 Tax=Mycena alexandri TaxID=1745969 RepID=A0AAD6XIH2_9AGAR|nr:hypothetical protein C8F04DRAFT_1173227 [Mycena alexandri]